MFGIDLSTMLGLLFALVISCGLGLAYCIHMLGKAAPAPPGTWQAKGQAAIAAKDIHQLDDVLKMTPLWDELRTIKQHLSALATKAEADAKQAGAALSGAVSNAAANFHVPAAVKVDGGPTADPEIARLQQQIKERTAAIQRQLAASAVALDVPPANPGEGLETYAARVGIDAAEMRLLSALHPADTWEMLADRRKNPSRYFTDADRDTVAAASSSPAAVNR